MYLGSIINTSPAWHDVGYPLPLPPPKKDCLSTDTVLGLCFFCNIEGHYRRFVVRSFALPTLTARCGGTGKFPPPKLLVLG